MTRLKFRCKHCDCAGTLIVHPSTQLREIHYLVEIQHEDYSPDCLFDPKSISVKLLLTTDETVEEPEKDRWFGSHIREIIQHFKGK